jgi:hypothetical protein
MTDEERQILDTQMKVQAILLMVRNLYLFVNKMDGMSGNVADNLRAFLEEDLPAMTLPMEVPAEVLAAIKAALAEPVRLVVADVERGEEARPQGPKLTLLRGGLDDAPDGV